MNPELQDCLKRKKIQEFSRGKALVEKEFKTASQDYDFAKTSFNSQNFKWATIQSYYAMFHCARALLFSENLREKSHYCLIVAIRALFVDKQLLPPSLIESLQKAKILRENADYYDNWSEEAAGLLLKSAEHFLEMADKLLHKKNK